MDEQQQVQGINISDYLTKKEKGLIDVVKLGKDYAISFKRFNPETGEEVAPRIAGISLVNLEGAKVNLQNQIRNIDIMIADLKSLDKSNN